MPTGYDSQTGQVNVVKRRRIVGTWTRPADTNAYTAGDAVNNSTTAPVLVTLAGAGRANGGSGKVTQVQLVTNLAVVTNGTFRVYFFNTSFTPQADNAVATGVAGNAAYLQGYVDLPVLTADAAGSTSAVTRVDEKVAGGDDGVPLAFECAAGNSALYALVVATGAYTPASGQTFTLQIAVEQD
jgi:hypothetical protein